MYVGFINNFTKKTPWAKNTGEGFAPYFGTIGLYLGVANMVGLIGVTPPYQGPERDGCPGHYELRPDLWFQLPHQGVEGRNPQVL